MFLQERNDGQGRLGGRAGALRRQRSLRRRSLHRRALAHIRALRIETATQHETQSSSGLIVSTGLGSTAWFKSIVTGSLAIEGIRRAIGNCPLFAVGLGRRGLQFVVREPFPSKTSGPSWFADASRGVKDCAFDRSCPRMALSSATASRRIAWNS